MSFDAAKVFDNKLNWLLFSSFYSVVTAVLTLLVPFYFVYLIAMLIPRIIYPMLNAHTFHEPQMYALFGTMLTFWLSFHYFFGYLYVSILSKVAGSKRALLARTLTIVAGVAWFLLLLFHAITLFMELWIGCATICGDLLFILGLIIALRKIKKQAISETAVPTK